MLPGVPATGLEELQLAAAKFNSESSADTVLAVGKCDQSVLQLFPSINNVPSLGELTEHVRGDPSVAAVVLCAASDESIASAFQALKGEREVHAAFFPEIHPPSSSMDSPKRSLLQDDDEPEVCRSWIV